MMHRMKQKHSSCGHKEKSSDLSRSRTPGKTISNTHNQTQIRLQTFATSL